MWFPGVGALPLRQDEAPRSLSNQQSRLAVQCPPTMQNEPCEPAVEEKTDPQSWPHQTNTFGTSFGLKQASFEQPKTDQKPILPVRGGIQVLPPVVPPRAVNGSIPSPQQPVATPRPKPKPPLPPKRDELTRLTTVKRDLEKVPPPPPIRTSTLSEQQKPLDQVIPDVVPNHVKQEDKEGKQLPPEVPPRPEESALRVLVESEEENASIDVPDETELPLVPEEFDLPKPDVDLSQDNSLGSPSSEDGATADIWVRAIDSPIRKRPAVAEEHSSNPPSRHASTSGDDADEKGLKTAKTESQPKAKHRAVLDKSYIKCLKENNDIPVLAPSPKVEDVQTPTPVSVDISESNAQAEQLTSNSSPSAQSDSSKHPPCRVSESLPCSRPSSRATSRSSSPASFVSEKQSSSKSGRISAAEALGVVAKPCPRPPPSKRSKQPQEYRRQSLGNLSDSKLSVGYDRNSNNCGISCTIRGLWNSVGETEVVSESAKEYRRHDRAHRGSSADGTRTLSRIKFDCGHPSWDGESLQGYLERDTQSVSGYSTLSRIGRIKPDKHVSRSATPVQCGYSSADSSSVRDDSLTKKSLKSIKVDSSGRPKSTCNCGHHNSAGVRVDSGKRTFSVEELTTAFSRGCEFTRPAPGSARGSFGKSPRVTFALAEDMGASGGAISKHSESDRVSGGASKKILRGRSLPTPGTESDDGIDSRMSSLQHKQYPGGGLPPTQVNITQQVLL